MAQPLLAGQFTGKRRLGVLPIEPNSFIGRTAEAQRLTALLRAARLVTVVGPGGVGKSRLCLHIASGALTGGRFADGVVLVELSGLRDPALLASAVAAGLGLPERDPGLQRAAVLDHVRDRRMLLILDTCEHLVDACAAFVEAVLRAAPEVTVLATSRQPFDAPGEHAFPVAPLPIEGDAVELFAQRAAAAAPGFAVTSANRVDVVRLCRRLNGMPLAIELAAVRLRALPLAELADMLDSGFSVLTVTRRGGAARHQTLRTAIEWSHALCTPAEQALWRRVSVFAGPFDLAAAEEVCADAALPTGEVVHALIGLVDKSVVMRDGDAGEGDGVGGDRVGGDGFDRDRFGSDGFGSDGFGSAIGGASGAAGGANRYRLLDTLREFGAEQLAEAGEQARFLDRLTDRCLAMAADFDERFLADDQAGRLRRLRAEHVNISTALRHALDDSDGDGDAGLVAADQVERWRRGCWLAVRLHAYWRISGQLGEGRHWLDKALRVFPGWSPERAWALGVRGTLATFQGDPDNAIADISESIRLAGELGDEVAAARGYLYLNLALTFAGQYPQALTAGRIAAARLAASDQRSGLVYLQTQLAQSHQLAGDVDAALKCCERGLAMLGDFSRPGEERWITGLLDMISGFALFQLPGRDDDCAAAIRQALAAMRDLGDEAGIAYCLEVLGWLAARGSRSDQAAWLLGAADTLWRRTTCRLGNVAIMEQSHQRSAKQAREALGGLHYESAHDRGAAHGLAAVVAWAVDESGAAPWPDGVSWPRDHAEALASAAGNAAARAADGDGSEPRAAASVAALTRREREIALLVASGLSNRDIAARLFISKRTVDAHVEHIFAKLEISSRVKLTMWLQAQVRIGA
jgi:predicted ATPase/DNA-binding CsgD family transcriptional regulator